MDKTVWQEVAERRILKILGTRRLASKRQLEIKISEAGPPNMRANPHHITKALKELLEKGDVIAPISVSSGTGQPTTLFTLSNWDSTSSPDSERLVRVRDAYEEFLTITQNEDNGTSLETMIQRAIQKSNAYEWLNQPGKSPPSGLRVSGNLITGSGTLDHYLVWRSSSSILIGVEDKNYRDWIYPSRKEIKSLLQKCQKYGMLPVLVARKIHYTTRLFFHYLGAVAFETHFQYFDPKYSSRLSEARHKDGLGFADIRFSEDPPQHLVNLFSNLLPKLAIGAWEKFQNNASLVSAYTSGELDYYHLIGELGIIELEEDDLDVEDIY